MPEFELVFAGDPKDIVVIAVWLQSHVLLGEIWRYEGSVYFYFLHKPNDGYPEANRYSADTLSAIAAKMIELSQT